MPNRSGHAQKAMLPRAPNGIAHIIAAIEKAGHVAGPEKLNDAGVFLAGQGRMAEAIGCYERALALRPVYALALNNLGLALCQTGRIDDALAAHHRAIAVDPNYADGHHGLALALAAVGQRDSAIDHHGRALALDPGHVEALVGLGGLSRDADKLDDALTAHQRAAALRPQDAEIVNQLGITLRERNDMAAAIACFRRAVAAQPAHVNAHMNLAMALLAIGDFRAGGAEYEWRLRKDPRRPPVDTPLWDGRPLGDGTLLLCAEQGLGDTIQFVRYAPLLRARVGRLVLACPPPLAPLLRNAPGLHDVISFGAKLPRVDAYLPLLSVMQRLGTELGDVPATTPYLTADAAPGPALAALLDGGGPRIGLVWRGNPNHPNDRRRSLPLALLRPLLEVAGPRFFSLQLGAPAGELADPTLAGRVTDLAPQLRDFADTAAAMSALDLIITVDSAAAHLAGALGRPCWVLLPFSADWRWLLERGDSPWYPTMRLFRQPRCGEWPPVITALIDQLACRFDGIRGTGAGAPPGPSPQFCH